MSFSRLLAACASAGMSPDDVVSAAIGNRIAIWFKGHTGDDDGRRVEDGFEPLLGQATLGPATTVWPVGVDGPASWDASLGFSQLTVEELCSLTGFGNIKVSSGRGCGPDEDPRHFFARDYELLAKDLYVEQTEWEAYLALLNVSPAPDAPTGVPPDGSSPPDDSSPPEASIGVAPELKALVLLLGSLLDGIKTGAVNERTYLWGDRLRIKGFQELIKRQLRKIERQAEKRGEPGIPRSGWSKRTVEVVLRAAARSVDAGRNSGGFMEALDSAYGGSSAWPKKRRERAAEKLRLLGGALDASWVEATWKTQSGGRVAAKGAGARTADEWIRAQQEDPTVDSASLSIDLLQEVRRAFEEATKRVT